MKRFSGQYKTTSPGPKYEPNKTEHNSEHKQFPTISFGKDRRWSKRKATLDALSPSPSHYNLPKPKERHVKPIKIDMSQNEILDALRESKNKSPGPQSYFPDLAKILARPAPKIVFGNQNRFSLVFKER